MLKMKYYSGAQVNEIITETLDGKQLIDVLERFAKEPTADVQEVKHGEWVFKFYCGNMSGYDYGMNCSVCGKPTHRQFAEKMPPFCPNCGAKMDEVEHNAD